MNGAHHGKTGNIFLRMHPLQRIFWSIVTAAAVLFFIPHRTPTLIIEMTAWLAFGLTYLSITWVVLFKRPIPQIRKFAQQDDGSKPFVFIMILLFSFSSLVIALQLM